jgi:protein TonB
MPQALLLSPDDQAVNAITAVLEEMSVTCERPLDGASAAQQLYARSFDLVLVDCDNLAAAKLIFDVCRRGHNGYNPVPIAIVDGRAGLPTAFRLGAELILTKPVAKDQARSTFRTAVSRVQKEASQPGSVPAPAATEAGAVHTEAHALAAAAVSSHSANSADSAWNVAPVGSATASNAARTATIEPPVTTAATSAASSTLSAVEADPDTAAFAPSADLDRASVLDSRHKQSESAELQQHASELEIMADEPVPVRLTSTSASPSAGLSQPEPSQSELARLKPAQSKNQNSLVAMLTLILAAGGLYTAWMYQPAFHAFAQLQIDRVMIIAGVSQIPAPSPMAVKPAPSLTPAPVPPPAPASASNPDQTPAAASDPTTSTAAFATTSTPATAPSQPSTAARTTVAPTASTNATSPAAPSAAPGIAQVSQSSDLAKAPAAALSDKLLPGENSGIILSSKGAEKRLAYSVAPKFPPARAATTEGTIVLKALVDENGKIAGLRLVEGSPALATPAIEAVKQWRYRPYVRDGKAEPFQTVVILDPQQP